MSFIKFLYIDGYEHVHLIRLIKSITFFRFFLMLVIACFLVELGILNFKYFIISSAFFPILVSVDVIYQYFFGFNIIGIETFRSNILKPGQYITSFFGDELIAGSYIKNFSFFSILFLIFKLENKKKTRFILTTVAICILGLGILLSGNKMPIPLFILGLFMIFFFNDNLKKMIMVSFICLFIIFYFTFSFDHLKKRSFFISIYAPKYYMTKLYNKLSNRATSTKYFEKYQMDRWKKVPLSDFDSFQKIFDSSTISGELFLHHHVFKEEKEGPLGDFDSFWRRLDSSTGTTELFLTALDLWGKNKIFGNGIKSFRIDCGKLQEYKKDRLCSSHPHNYYVEILTETGLVGFFITSVIGLLFVIFIFKNFRFLRGNKKENLILLAAITSLFIEVFPIRSTGSIFTTSNATYLILIGSIILSHNKLSSAENFG